MRGHSAAAPARAQPGAADADQADATDLARDRTVALVVESMIILVPCVLWFIYYNRQLSLCGSVPNSAGQCSAVITRFLTSLAGLIVTGLLTIGASAALARMTLRRRRR